MNRTTNICSPGSDAGAGSSCPTSTARNRTRAAGRDASIAEILRSSLVTGTLQSWAQFYRKPRRGEMMFAHARHDCAPMIFRTVASASACRAAFIGAQQRSCSQASPPRASTGMASTIATGAPQQAKAELAYVEDRLAKISVFARVIRKDQSKTAVSD